MLTLGSLVRHSASHCCARNDILVVLMKSYDSLWINLHLFYLAWPSFTPYGQIVVLAPFSLLIRAYCNTCGTVQEWVVPLGTILWMSFTPSLKWSSRLSTGLLSLFNSCYICIDQWLQVWICNIRDWRRGSQSTSKGKQQIVVFLW